MHENAPIRSGGATSRTAAEEGPHFRSPEEEIPIAAELTTGTRPKKKKRQLQNLIKWSREEKKIIYFCYQVFHNKIWGRGKCKSIFTINTFFSIVFQIPSYLNSEDMKEIETNARKTVQEINNNITEDERIELYKNQWNRKEIS